MNLSSKLNVNFNSTNTTVLTEYSIVSSSKSRANFQADGLLSKHRPKTIDCNDITIHSNIVPQYLNGNTCSNFACNKI